MGPDPARRIASIRLRPGDPEGEKELCLLLQRERDLTVRTAAAAALGKGGSEAALPVLLEALQGCYARRSHGWNRTVGTGIAAACVLLTLGAALGEERLEVWLHGTTVGGLALLLLFGGALGVWSYFLQQAQVRKLICTLGDAIVAITERTGSSQGRGALPLLESTAADFLQCDRDTRTRARQLAERVDTLTRDVGRLPVPSTSPLTADVLPRPSQPAPPAPETLPRVRT